MDDVSLHDDVRHPACGAADDGGLGEARREGKEEGAENAFHDAVPFSR